MFQERHYQNGLFACLEILCILLRDTAVQKVFPFLVLYFEKKEFDPRKLIFMKNI